LSLLCRLAPVVPALAVHPHLQKQSLSILFPLFPSQPSHAHTHTHNAPARAHTHTRVRAHMRARPPSHWRLLARAGGFTCARDRSRTWQSRVDFLLCLATTLLCEWLTSASAHLPVHVAGPLLKTVRGKQHASRASRAPHNCPKASWYVSREQGPFEVRCDTRVPSTCLPCSEAISCLCHRACTHALTPRTRAILTIRQSAWG
jgi:hypothetical protein